LGRLCRGLETAKEHLSAALLGAFTLAGIFTSVAVLRLGQSPASLAEVGNLTLETGLLAAYCIPPTAVAYRFWFLPAFELVERRRPTQLRRYLHLTGMVLSVPISLGPFSRRLSFGWDYLAHSWPSVAVPCVAAGMALASCHLQSLRKRRPHPRPPEGLLSLHQPHLGNVSECRPTTRCS